MAAVANAPSACGIERRWTSHKGGCEVSRLGVLSGVGGGKCIIILVGVSEVLGAGGMRRQVSGMGAMAAVQASIPPGASLGMFRVSLLSNVLTNNRYMHTVP